MCRRLLPPAKAGIHHHRIGGLLGTRGTRSNAPSGAFLPPLRRMSKSQVTLALWRPPGVIHPFFLAHSNKFESDELAIVAT